MNPPITSTHYSPSRLFCNFYPYISGVGGKDVLVVGCKAGLIEGCVGPHEDLADKGVGEGAEFAGDDCSEVGRRCCAGEDEGPVAGGGCRRHDLSHGIPRIGHEDFMVVISRSQKLER